MNLIEKLQTQLLPKYKGLIWITDESLSDTPSGFHALDYFFDGLLTEYKKSHSNEAITSMTLLSTESFGSPFSLTHICTKSENTAQDFSNALTLFKGKSEQEIALINLSQSFKSKNNNSITQIVVD